MKRIKGLFTIMAVLLLSVHTLHAEGLTYEELTEPWLKTKAEAFDRANAEGKFIILFSGRTICPNCISTLTAFFGEEIQSIVNESYVQWYVDWDNMSTNSQSDARIYYKEVVNDLGGKKLPAIFIIDPANPGQSLVYGFGKKTGSVLVEFLNVEGRPVIPVSNEIISLTPGKVYISGNTLFVSGNNLNETITVHTMLGQAVSVFKKNETGGMADTSSFPKGILIVSSSAGWSSKVVNR